MEDATREAVAGETEQVAAILSNSSVFKQRCKDNFRRFDANGDGVLQWSEIECLTTALYRSFDLREPCLASLRAFFVATDDNGDGVLSEREFRRFFECFLRYAFFDEHRRGGKARRTPMKGHGARHRQGPAGPETGGLLASPVLQNVAGHEVTYRRGPERIQKPMEVSVPAGGKVRVLEHWVLTCEGWLPLADLQGNVLFERVAAQGPEGAALGAAELAQPGAETASPARERKPRGSQVEAMQHSHSEPSLTAASHLAGRCTDHVQLQGRSPAKEREASVGSARRQRPLSGLRPAPQPDAPAAVSGQRHSVGDCRTPGPRRHRSLSRLVSACEADAVPNAGALGPGEEDWADRLKRLKERFPMLGEARVLEVLREKDGHAGKAATVLRGDV